MNIVHVPSIPLKSILKMFKAFKSRDLKALNIYLKILNYPCFDALV